MISAVIDRVPDFDNVKMRLKLNRILMILRRYILNKNGDNVWLYGCSCDPDELNFINTLDTVTEYTQPGFDSSLCQHICAVMPVISDLMKWNDGEDPFGFQLTDYPDGDISELSLNSKKVLILKDDTVGVVNFDDVKYFCGLCSSPYCQHIVYVKSFHEKSDCPSILMELFAKKGDTISNLRYSYPTASWRKIPFEPNERMQRCLRFEPPSYIDVESEVLLFKDRDLINCIDSSSPMEICYSNTVLLFTKNSSFSCKIPVFSKRCVHCEKVFEYDGRHDAIFNMCTFMIYYGILRDYMLHFLNGNSCTLHGYYEVLALSQEHSGNFEFRSSLSYNKFRFCWYAHLNLVEINLAAGSSCRSCGEIPAQVVCDATGLGYQRKFASLALPVTDTNTYPRFL